MLNFSAEIGAGREIGNKCAGSRVLPEVRESVGVISQARAWKERGGPRGARTPRVSGESPRARPAAPALRLWPASLLPVSSGLTGVGGRCWQGEGCPRPERCARPPGLPSSGRPGWSPATRVRREAETGRQ